MSSIFSRKEVVWLLNLSVLAVLGSSSSVLAETTDTNSGFQLTQNNETQASSSQINAEVDTSTPNVSTQTPVRSSVQIAQQVTGSNVAQPQQILTNNQQYKSDQFVTSVPVTTAQFPRNVKLEKLSRVVTPVPGTTATTSAAFSTNDTESTSQPSVPSKTQLRKSSNRVAQADIEPGRATRGGSSYVGVAGNIGLSGASSALGDGNFTIISKIGLTRSISVRPAAVLGDDTVLLFPVTYDFSFKPISDPFSPPLPIAPYVGAGAAIRTGSDSQAAFLLTGGIDVPISPQFTATAAINAAFFDDTSVGILLGVGYNFRGL
ncbi:MAG: hypothetical protein PUP93_20050 [Rhizonema sp. NSF051]|nr:hypothetical protein [Rhizonema sp. NSF051]